LFRSRGLLTVIPVRHWVLALLPPNLPAGSPLAGQALTWARGLTWVLVFLLLVGFAEAAGRAVGLVLTRVLHQARLTGTLNSLGGGVAGLLEHGLLAGLLLTLVLTAPLVHGTVVAHTIRQAPLASDLVRWFGRVAHLPGVWAL
ncbi:MAG: colicin V synthesis protein, partial [Firmicutes bacterium]|nr:colicin V synthesis protein [Bacillota bacterium]